MKSFDERVRSVEALLGTSLPPDYLAFLLRPVRPDASRIGVPFRDELWDVAQIFELGDGPDYLQLDATFRLVHDVLPRYHLPIAADHADNFFCLVVQGNQAGQIVWWDHEREEHELTTESVADSLSTWVSAMREIADA
jgi:hypothetical protein